MTAANKCASSKGSVGLPKKRTSEAKSNRPGERSGSVALCFANTLAAAESIAVAFVIVRVQELLGLLANSRAGLAEVVLVEGLNQMTYRVSHARIIPQRYKPPQPGEVPRHALWRFAADDAFATAAVPALAFQRRLSSGRPSRTCAVKLSLPRLPPPPVATAATRALAFCRGPRFGFSTPTVQRSTEPHLRGKAIASPLTTAAGRNCRAKGASAPWFATAPFQR